jgi:serine protease Do
MHEPPAPANKRAIRDEEALMTKASNNERSASPPKRLLIACVLAALVVAGCSADEKPAGGAKREKGEGTTPGATAAKTPASGNVPWPVARVAAEVEPSVVQVNVQAVQETPSGLEEAQGLGSGVIYREDGYIITNNHVVEGANEVNVAFVDGSSEGGEVVGGDRYTDITVVRVDRDGLPAADFAENLSLRVGELAAALGSPSGFQATVTAGVISGLGREVPPEVTGGQAQDPSLVDLIQTDAAISPGSSGGALANEDGEVVGINVAYLTQAQMGAVDIGFAIPSPAAVSVADQLIEDGEAEHPYLGVSLANLTPEIAEQFGISAESGVLVTDVDPKGPAAEAGIEPGIMLTALGSQGVADTGDLLAALRDYGPGDTVELAVAAEAGETREVSVELGERG